jgi:hypothetical protein
MIGENTLRALITEEIEQSTGRASEMATGLNISKAKV